MATQSAELKRLRAPLDFFIVDGFAFTRPDVRHYFLTHAHADHTAGLRSSFNAGMIYCSEVTARLIVKKLGVDRSLLRTIEVGEEMVVEGTRVVALDAGHCPGALMFLFRHPSGHRALHTGDCRASDDVIAGACRAMGIAAPTCEAPARASEPACSSSTGGARPARGAALPRGSALDVLYLDTTYASPRWRLPPQEAVLRRIGELVGAAIAREPRTLIVVGSYSIGKEKAIRAAATAAGGRALVSGARGESLRHCGEWDDAVHTETDDASVRVHVAPMGTYGGRDGHAALGALLDKSDGRYVAAMFIRPTGWSYAKGWASARDWFGSGGRTCVCTVPYSEHSSYTELHALVGALRPRKIVPTVNAETAGAREALEAMFRPSMDLSQHRGTLNWHFGEGGKRKRAERGSRTDVTIDLVSSSSASAPPSPSACLLERSQAPTSPAVDPAVSPDVDPALLALREACGDGLPDEYLRELLRDAEGDVGAAANVHFGPNGGVAPTQSPFTAIMAGAINAAGRRGACAARAAGVPPRGRRRGISAPAAPRSKQQANVKLRGRSG